MLLASQILHWNTTIQNEMLKEMESFDKLFVDSFHFLWVSRLSSIGICVIFHVFTTDDNLQTFHTINPFLAANEETNMMRIND